MTINVKKYVEFCSACRRIKPTKHLLHSELQLLPLPMGPKQDWTMDFTIGLLPSKLMGIVFDAIFVVVDGYTKFAKYILFYKDWKVKMLGDALVREVWSKCGLPVSLITNQGSLFILNY